MDDPSDHPLYVISIDEIAQGEILAAISLVMQRLNQRREKRQRQRKQGFGALRGSRARANRSDWRPPSLGAIGVRQGRAMMFFGLSFVFRSSVYLVVVSAGLRHP